MRGVVGCGGKGGVWWEGCRCVEGVVECSGRGEVCDGRCGGVWEG